MLRRIFQLARHGRLNSGLVCQQQRELPSFKLARYAQGHPFPVLRTGSRKIHSINPLRVPIRPHSTELQAPPIEGSLGCLKCYQSVVVLMFGARDVFFATFPSGQFGSRSGCISRYCLLPDIKLLSQLCNVMVVSAPEMWRNSGPINFKVSEEDNF